MNTINMNVSKPFPVLIGYSGENEVETIIFDYSDWVTKFGSGTLSLAFKRPGDPEPYPIALTLANNSGTWEISNTDTAVRGKAQAQLVYTVSGAIKKSCIFDVYIQKSLEGSADPPDPYENWFDVIVAARNDSESYSEDSEAWAAGTRNGEAVSSSDDTFHNNAKYYSEQAAATVESKVTGPGLTLSVDEASGIATITY